MSDTCYQEFAFARGQRVTVPTDAAGAEGVQAVVKSVTGFLGREPEYHIEWLSADTVREDGDLVSRAIDISQSSLVRAQPQKMISLADAHAMIDEDRKRNYEKYLDDVRGLTMRIERLQRKSRKRR